MFKLELTVSTVTLYKMLCVIYYVRVTYYIDCKENNSSIQ